MRNITEQDVEMCNIPSDNEQRKKQAKLQDIENALLCLIQEQKNSHFALSSQFLPLITFNVCYFLSILRILEFSGILADVEEYGSNSDS